MSQKKTDWEIARGLADWVMTLGLPDYGKHQRWANGKEVPFGYSDGICVGTYVSGDFVSLSLIDNGEQVYEVSIHLTSISGTGIQLGEEHPTPDSVIEATLQLLHDLNIRKWNRVFRQRLRFLETTAKEREIQIKQDRIKKLETELADLKGQE